MLHTTDGTESGVSKITSLKSVPIGVSEKRGCALTEDFRTKEKGLKFPTGDHQVDQCLYTIKYIL